MKEIKDAGRLKLDRTILVLKHFLSNIYSSLFTLKTMLQFVEMWLSDLWLFHLFLLSFCFREICNFILESVCLVWYIYPFYSLWSQKCIFLNEQSDRLCLVIAVVTNKERCHAKNATHYIWIYRFPAAQSAAWAWFNLFKYQVIQNVRALC